MGSRLYIGHLHQDVRDRDLDKLFSRYGRITDLRLMTGFGFVEFRDEREARDAVRAMDGYEFFGERLLVQFARRERRSDNRFNPPERTSNRLIVAGLASGTSWQDLKDLMRGAGDVTFADIFRGGEGVVEFRSTEDMRRALKDLQGTDLRGNKINLRESDREGERRDDRQGGISRRGRSRSPRRDDRYGGGRRRSRSRSRSRSPRRDDRYGGRRRSRSRSPRRDDRVARRSRSRSRSRSVSGNRSPARNARNYDRSPSPRARSVSPVRNQSTERVWTDNGNVDRAASPENRDWDNTAAERDDDVPMPPAASPGRSRSRSRSPYGQDRD